MRDAGGIIAGTSWSDPLRSRAGSRILFQDDFSGDGISQIKWTLSQGDWNVDHAALQDDAHSNPVQTQESYLTASSYDYDDGAFYPPGMNSRIRTKDISLIDSTKATLEITARYLINDQGADHVTIWLGGEDGLWYAISPVDGYPASLGFQGEQREWKTYEFDLEDYVNQKIFIVIEINCDEDGLEADGFQMDKIAVQGNRIGDLPDLEIVYMEMNNDRRATMTAMTGERVEIVVTLSNKGGEDLLDPFSVELRSIKDNELFEIIGKECYLDGLKKGNQASVYFTWIGIVGDYTLEAIADPESIIEELREDNNVKQAEYWGDANSNPDVAVTHIRIEKDEKPVAQAVSGQEHFIAVDIYNPSNKDVKNSFLLTVFDDEETALGELGNESLGRLNAFERKTISFAWTPDSGNHKIIARVDIVDEIEQNNRHTISITASSQKLPDLMAIGLQFQIGDSQVSSLDAMESVDISFQIINDGTTDISSKIPVSVYLGDPGDQGEIIGSVILEPLNHGQSAQAKIPWQSIQGEHDIYLQIDPQGIVDERDENNNIMSQNIIVAELEMPDLELNEIHYSLSSGTGQVIKSYDSVFFCVKLKNSGSKTAKDGMKLVLSLAPIKDGLTGDFNQILEAQENRALGPGQDLEIKKEWTAQAGEYILRIAVDSDNDLLELWESNNFIFMKLSVENVSAGNLAWNSVMVQSKSFGTSQSISPPSVFNQHSQPILKTFPRDEFKVDLEVENLGPGKINGTLRIEIYTSEDINQSLSNNNVLPLGSVEQHIDLVPKEYKIFNLNFSLPGSLEDTQFVVLNINPDKNLRELSYAENIALFPIGFGEMDLSLGNLSLLDLKGSALNSLSMESQVNISSLLTNQGGIFLKGSPVLVVEGLDESGKYVNLTNKTIALHLEPNASTDLWVVWNVDRDITKIRVSLFWDLQDQETSRTNNKAESAVKVVAPSKKKSSGDSYWGTVVIVMLVIFFLMVIIIAGILAFLQYQSNQEKQKASLDPEDTGAQTFHYRPVDESEKNVYQAPVFKTDVGPGNPDYGPTPSQVSRFQKAPPQKPGPSNSQVRGSHPWVPRPPPSASKVDAFMPKDFFGKMLILEKPGKAMKKEAGQDEQEPIIKELKPIHEEIVIDCFFCDKEIRTQPKEFPAVIECPYCGEKGLVEEMPDVYNDPMDKLEAKKSTALVNPRFCKNCGGVVERGWLICPKCNVRLGQ